MSGYDRDSIPVRNGSHRNCEGPEQFRDPHRYDDIIHLPHHQSTERKHMSLHDRAAQFAPFAALSGYEEAIEETVALTEAENDGIVALEIYT